MHELKSLRKQYGGRLLNGNCCFSAVSTDTRHIEAGQLFVALRGENFDAHNFLELAVKKQAVGLVVEQAREDLSVPQWEVDDSIKALGDIAREHRAFFLRAGSGNYWEQWQNQCSQHDRFDIAAIGADLRDPGQFKQPHRCAPDLDAAA